MPKIVRQLIEELSLLPQDSIVVVNDSEYGLLELGRVYSVPAWSEENGRWIPAAYSKTTLVILEIED